MFFHKDLKGLDLPPRTLCLTYDDGPGRDTPELARFLSDEGVRATFFVMGRHAEESPGAIDVLVRCGQFVGNHTYGHPGLVGLAESGGDVVAEIARAHAVLRRHSVPAPFFFRAPYGNWRAKRPGTEEDNEFSIVADLLNASGRFPEYIGPVNWDINVADYDFWKRGDPPEDCVMAFREKIARMDRGIVLMHDSSEDPDVAPRNGALEVTRRLVPQLKREGYHFVGLDEVPQVRGAMANAG